MIGDMQVGKTSLIKHVTGQGFSEDVMATQGVDFVTKEDFVPQNNPSVFMKVHFWDTAGQERHHALAKSFFVKSQGVAICFDLTQDDSFRNVA